MIRTTENGERVHLVELIASGISGLQKSRFRIHDELIQNEKAGEAQNVHNRISSGLETTIGTKREKKTRWAVI